MSILIKGMEMPEDGETVTLTICADGLVFEEFKEPGDVFHAVPVPAHGRLIDADALEEHKFVCIPKVIINGKYAGSAYRLGWNSAIEAIVENAETIIGGE